MQTMTFQQLSKFAVSRASFAADLVMKEPQPAKRYSPFSKTGEGRKRRKARRAARQAKAAWLFS